MSKEEHIEEINGRQYDRKQIEQWKDERIRLVFRYKGKLVFVKHHLVLVGYKKNINSSWEICE